VTEVINLSYVLTTRNKLPYLKECLPLLLKAVQPDEEIVIVDGASTDGTVDYLKALFEGKRIDKFISEPDRGEGHALSKAFLLASGELIKVITDDDYFYWPNIQKCKDFMLEHKEIDILGTNGAAADWNMKKSIAMMKTSAPLYENWMVTGKPFDFCGLGIMLRRGSVPLLGLPHSGLSRIDMEYTCRATSIPASLAWFTGVTWVRLDNPSSNFRKYYGLMLTERKRTQRFYNMDTNSDRLKIIPYVRWKIIWILSTVSHKLFGPDIRRRWFGYRKKVNEEKATEIPCGSRMEVIEDWIERINRQNPGRFLYRSISDR
jgi:glycosyltransferase involved in cell wall biosynthesis